MKVLSFTTNIAEFDDHFTSTKARLYVVSCRGCTLPRSLLRWHPQVVSGRFMAASVSRKPSNSEHHMLRSWLHLCSFQHHQHNLLQALDDARLQCIDLHASHRMTPPEFVASSPDNAMTRIHLGRATARRLLPWRQLTVLSHRQLGVEKMAESQSLNATVGILIFNA